MVMPRKGPRTVSRDRVGLPVLAAAFSFAPAQGQVARVRPLSDSW